MTEFATSWTAIAASRRPAILVNSSTPLSVSTRRTTTAKRIASQIASATAIMAPARANPSPTPCTRWTNSIVATMGVAHSGTISKLATWAGGSGYQGLVRLGGDRFAANTVPGKAAVIVTAARGHQAEIVRQGEQAGPFGIYLVGMEDLYAGQAYGGQPADLLVGHYPVAACPRVGQHRDAARDADQADRVDRIERVPADV